MKALELLKTNKSVAERADSYIKTIARNIQKNVLDQLIQKKEKLEDEMFDLENFTLSTNLNQGLKTMTREDCEERFIRLIDVKYELELTNLELKTKTGFFEEYFEEETAKSE